MSAISANTPPLRRASRHLRYVLVALLWISAFLLLADIHVGGDGMSYYAYVRSTIIDGDLNFYNEDGNHNLYRHAMTAYNARTHTGYVHNQFAIGPAILWSPFFLIGHVWASLTGIVRDGYTFPYVFTVTLGTALYSTGGLLLMHRTVRQFVGREPARWASTSLWLGSVVVFYTFKDATYSHAASFFASSALIYGWLRARESQYSWSSCLILGGLTGIATLMRWQNVLFGILPGLDLLRYIIDRHIRSRDLAWHFGIGHASTIALGALIGFLPQALAWDVIYGRPFVIPQGGGFVRFLQAEILQVLMSPYHGLFVYTPIALLGVTGLLVFAHRHRWLGALLIIAAGLQIYISATVIDWWAGYSFGMRRLANITPILAVGLGALLNQLWDRPRMRKMAQLLLFLLILWNLVLTVQVGQRSWLDPDDRTWSFYLAAIRRIPDLATGSWPLWQPQSAYLPHLVEGVRALDPVIIQSYFLLVVAASLVPWMDSLLNRPRTKVWLVLMVAMLVTASGYIIYCAQDTRTLLAADLGSSPIRMLPTTLHAHSIYESLLVTGPLEVDHISINVEATEVSAIELLLADDSATDAPLHIEVLLIDTNNEARRFAIAADPETQFSPTQEARRYWLDPFPTPMHMPYWLTADDIALQQLPLQFVRLELPSAVSVTSLDVWAIDKSRTPQIHSLSLVPAN